jgi:hypothetical protein
MPACNLAAGRKSFALTGSEGARDNSLPLDIYGDSPSFEKPKQIS